MNEVCAKKNETRNGILIKSRKPLLKFDILNTMNTKVIGIGAITTAHYQGKFTYDLLPAGETGTYYADDILLKSTLQ